MGPYNTLELARDDGSAWITPVERFDDEVREYANRVSSIPPRVSELILTGLRHAPVMDLDTTLEWEANAIAMAVSTPEARAAFAEFKAQKTR